MAKEQRAVARSIYFPDNDGETFDKIQRLADKSGRTVNSVMVTILKNEVDSYLGDTSKLEPRV